MSGRTPMDLVFYLSAANNVFAILGLAGVINAQRELVTAFFAYNTVQVVLSFHMFVDICVDSGIEFSAIGRQAQQITSYEKAAAAGVFFNFILSIAATVFAVKAVNEIRSKQRETYTQMATLGVDLP